MRWLSVTVALFAITACAGQPPREDSNTEGWRIRLEIAHPGSEKELRLLEEFSYVQNELYADEKAALDALNELNDRHRRSVWGWHRYYVRLELNSAVVIQADDDSRVCTGRIVVRESFGKHLRSLPDGERRLMERIDAAPTLHSGSNWNPVDMVNAANALLVLDETTAAQKLEDYLDLLHQWKEGFPRDSGWGDEQGRVQAIAMLLWSGDLLNISPALGAPGGLPGNVYDTMPLVNTVSDLPYLTASGYTLGGLPESARSFLNRIREEGQWRGTVLKPANNPFETCLAFEARVEELALPGEWELGRPYWRSLLRRQCLRCIGIDTGEEPYTLVGDNVLPVLAAGANTLILRWSPELGAYQVAD